MSNTQELIKVTQEKLPGSQISLEIEISPERSQQAYEQVIVKFMRSANIPGFRKGKVPRQVILQRFGVDQLKASALEDLVQKTFEAAVKQEQIDVLGNVQLKTSFEDLAADFQPGQALTYRTTVDIPPEVQLNKYQGFNVIAQKVEYDPAKVDEVLAEHQSDHATLVPVEGRAAAAGDVTLVDFSSQMIPIEGEESSEDESLLGEDIEDFQMELVEGKFLDDLVAGVIGMQVGETKEILVTLPAEHFQEELSNRSATFTLTLKEIKAKELPPLDDDFAQDVSDFGTLQELREFLEERYQKEAQEDTDANVDQVLLDALLTELEVDLPETMIQDELNIILRETLGRLQSSGLEIDKLINKEMLSEMRERMRPEATTRLQRTLTLAEVAKQESIVLDPQAIKARCQEVLQSLGDSKVDYQRLQEIVEDELLQQQVMTWLKEHSTVELVDSLPEVEVSAESEVTPEALPEAIPKTSKSKAKKDKDKDKDPDPEIETDPEPADTDQPAKAKSTPSKTTSKTKAKTTASADVAQKPDTAEPESAAKKSSSKSAAKASAKSAPKEVESSPSKAKTTKTSTQKAATKAKKPPAGAD